MRDLLKLIAAFPKEEQGQFKSVVLEVFNPERSSRPQPAEVIVLGKKLAVSGGYEKELNRVLQGQGGNGNSANAQSAGLSNFMCHKEITFVKLKKPSLYD